MIDKTLLRFLLVGVINTVFGSIVMFSLYNLFHVDYWISSASNYVLASLLSFFLNKYYTFHQKQWSLFIWNYRFSCHISKNE